MKKDLFTNIVQYTVTMSVANTIAFQEVNLGLNLFDNAGVLIHEMQYKPAHGALAELTSADDIFYAGIVQSNQVTSLSIAERAVIDSIEVSPRFGDNTGFELTEFPKRKSFTHLPGGGLLVSPTPLYVSVSTSGFAAISSCEIRMLFTIVKLTGNQFQELLQSRIFLT